eukprot:TRINITY_DN523_c2_g3_i1.p1 TRINITY_DN523_c2_g3~~TRINITY_DN523_c2_g3_i1.p1  ORF type:complete len:898 (+),score=199.16 TRINITY_DN523_c2_g3_i1:179-2872(+)
MSSLDLDDDGGESNVDIESDMMGDEFYDVDEGVEDYNIDFEYDDNEFGGEYYEDDGVNSQKTFSVPYVVLTESKILEEQEKSIQKVQEVLNISAPFARTLLMFFRWDLSQLLDIFFLKGKTEVYKKAGLLLEEYENLHSSQGDSQTSRKFECPVCMDDVDYQDTTSLSCGHRFCNGCWQTFVSLEIKEGRAKTLTCMAKGCGIKFDQDKIYQFLDAKQKQKYAKKLLESYVEDNPRVKWCRSVPHCGNAIMINQSEQMTLEVRCICDFKFCFNCSGQLHSPCSCQMVKLWDKRAKEKATHDQVITSKILQLNIKECPKCGSGVERVSGCNLMTCRCGQHFCWLCGGATGVEHTWDSIAGHQCGRYVPKNKDIYDTGGKEMEQEMARRFEFYQQRSNAHLQSAELEEKLIPLIKKKIYNLMSNVDQYCPDFYYNWLQHALEKLSTCRRILSWSYIFCFCLFDREIFKDFSLKTVQMKTQLFEDYQQQMESVVEKLSKILETKEDFVDVEFCKQVQRLTVEVDKRCKGLYDIIEKEILKDSSVQISPYIRTTEGLSTLLVNSFDAKYNLVQIIQLEKIQDELISSEKDYENTDELLLARMKELSKEEYYKNNSPASKEKGKLRVSKDKPKEPRFKEDKQEKAKEKEKEKEKTSVVITPTTPERPSSPIENRKFNTPPVSPLKSSNEGIDTTDAVNAAEKARQIAMMVDKKKQAFQSESPTKSSPVNIAKSAQSPSVVKKIVISSSASILPPRSQTLSSSSPPTLSVPNTPPNNNHSPMVTCDIQTLQNYERKASLYQDAVAKSKVNVNNQVQLLRQNPNQSKAITQKIEQDITSATVNTEALRQVFNSVKVIAAAVNQKNCDIDEEVGREAVALYQRLAAQAKTTVIILKELNDIKSNL